MKIKFCLICRKYFHNDEVLNFIKKEKLVKHFGFENIRIKKFICPQCSGEKEKQWERSGKKNKHHLTPRSRGGSSDPDNLLEMDISRHIAWHFLFGNKTLDEIIALLQRMQQCQKRKGGD